MVFRAQVGFLLGAIWRTQAQKLTVVEQHIICQTCETAMEIFASGQLGRLDDVDFAEEVFQNVCNPKRMMGKWMMQIDIVQDEKDGEQTLFLEKRPDARLCESECHTMKRACFVALRDQEALIQELVHAKSTAEKMQRKVCRPICKKYAKLPKLENFQDEEFKPISRKEAMQIRHSDEMEATFGLKLEKLTNEQRNSMSEEELSEYLKKKEFGARRQFARVQDKFDRDLYDIEL
mmetsp:Transcript_49994/g.79101  ORF Transcript_49994/g.79101 Transcript_49994/m.79101 type:complete len:234 (-) Transcript_49994:65-766(-)